MTARRRWTEETIAAELEPLVATLGRMPTRRECTEQGIGGVWAAMQRLGGLAGWRDRLLAGEREAGAPVAGVPAAVSAAAALPAAVEPAPEGPVARRAIEERAYYISRERGGDPVANWLAAERQLLAA